MQLLADLGGLRAHVAALPRSSYRVDFLPLDTPAGYLLARTGDDRCAALWFATMLTADGRGRLAVHGYRRAIHGIVHTTPMSIGSLEAPEAFWSH